MFANKTPIRRRISNYLTKFSVQVVILLQKWNHIIDCRTNDVTELTKTGVKLHFQDDFFAARFRSALDQRQWQGRMRKLLLGRMSFEQSSRHQLVRVRSGFWKAAKLNRDRKRLDSQKDYLANNALNGVVTRKRYFDNTLKRDAEEKPPTPVDADATNDNSNNNKRE